MSRLYRIRKGWSRGQYVLSRHNGYLWPSGYLQPTGKLQKRAAARSVRQFQGELSDGSAYKKLWGLFEWS